MATPARAPGVAAGWECPGAEAVAAYPYTHTAATKGKRKFLSFDTGDRFILIKQGQKEWWLAKAGADGHTGYIPANYLIPVATAAALAADHTAAATPTAASLERHPWFRGAVAREAAEAELAGQPPGTFLVRESLAKRGAFMLSVCAIGGGCRHMKVVPTAAGVTLGGAADTKTMPTLPDLLDAYCSTPVSPDVGRLQQPVPVAATNSKRSISRAAPLPPTATAAPVRAAPPPPAADYNTATPEGGVTEERARPARAAPAPPSNVVAAAMDVEVQREAELEPALPRLIDGGSASAAVVPAGGRAAAVLPPLPAAAPPTTDEDELPDPTFEADFDLPPLVPERIKDEVVQLVRDASGLSFDKSRMAAAAVIDYVVAATSKTTALGVLNAVQVQGAGAAEPGHEGADVLRLREVIDELTAMKNDAQQRSWSVYDDSPVILEYLEEFLALATEADPRAVASVIETFTSGGSGRYEVLDTLVMYYQMETRSALRVILLKLFAALGDVNPEVLPFLQDSRLPLELMRDVTTSAYTPDSDERILYSLKLAMVVLACGHPLPVTHYDTLNGAFVAGLSDVIEHDGVTETDGQISDHAADVLLAFNLHFPPHHANMITRTLATRRCNLLARRLLLLANRGDDPVPRIGSQPNAVLKFLSDLFHDADTAASFFYTSDRAVLLDVLIRNITDLEHDDPALLPYAFITVALVERSGYRDDEQPHRIADLRSCLESLASTIIEYYGSLELLELVREAIGLLPA